jgi:tetratricopeptide (TPR) repeat protein
MSRKDRSLGMFLLIVLLCCGAGVAQEDAKLNQSLAALNRAKFLHQEKRYPEAIAEYRRAIDLNDENPWAHNYLGLALASVRDFKGALKAFERAIDLNPDLTDVYNNMGVVYDQMGKKQEAYQAFSRVVGDPHYPTPEKALYNLGELYRGDQNYELALLHFQRATERRAKFALGHRGMGLVYKTMGKTEQATAAFEKAIELDPQDQPSLYELGLLLEADGKDDQSREFFRRAVDVDRLSALGQLSQQKLQGPATGK